MPKIPLAYFAAATTKPFNRRLHEFSDEIVRLSMNPSWIKPQTGDRTFARFPGKPSTVRRSRRLSGGWRRRCQTAR